jgi:signal peptidase I
MQGEQRVCPECGEPAGEQIFCARCGLNLSTRERTPALPPRRTASRRLLVAGFVLAALSLFLGLLTAIPAIVIGILVITRGRGGAGAAIITLAVALPVTTAIVLFGVLDARTYRIPSEAMLPTVEIGDRVMTTKTSRPERGDILVFTPPAGAVSNVCGVRHSGRSACPRPTEERSGTSFIKRVVAVGGDRLSVRGGRVYINGRPQREPYARLDGSCQICNLPEEITIPEGHYFMIGDNRGASADSRDWGPVREDWIIGEVRLRYWPPGRIGSP